MIHSHAMHIRPYHQADKDACLVIFDSNCPHYFDPSERKMFEAWLSHQSSEAPNYASPTYQNTTAEAYVVIENADKEIMACGGYYVLNDEREARMAWGMIHGHHHQKGYGTALYTFRKNQIKQLYPNAKISLGTSQHTFPFYKKMGLEVISIHPSGYGPHLDRYDMEDTNT